MHHVTKADGWTLHFPFAITGMTCFHCGLLFWQNPGEPLFYLFRVSFCKFSLFLGIEFLVMHIFVLWIAYSAIYQQAANALSSWLGLQLVERRQAASRERSRSSCRKTW
jgi:hypothetical protein